MSSPLESGDTDKPTRWFDENISLTLGIFAGHKAALIQTHKGTDSRYSLQSSLQYLPNIKLIIGLDFAYGRRNKSDVLISTCVDGVSNFRIEGGQILFDEGIVHYTNTSTMSLPREPHCGQASSVAHQIVSLKLFLVSLSVHLCS